MNVRAVTVPWKFDLNGRRTPMSFPAMQPANDPVST
jgi:hypothetical protein